MSGHPTGTGTQAPAVGTESHDPEPGPVAAKWRWPGRGVSGAVGLFLLAALCYSLGSKLALLLIEESGLTSVFFIPAGITIGLLLRVPRERWWVVVAAAGIAEGTMDLMEGYSVGSTAGYVAANMLEPVIGALIVERFCGVVDLARLRHLWWFFLGAVVIGPAVGATVGSAPAALLGESEFLVQAGQWWLGDALGVILVGSTILVWGSSPDRRSLASLLGTLVVAGTFLLTISVLAMTELPLLFLVMIGITVAGAVFGVRGVAVTALIVAGTIAGDLAFGFAQPIPGIDPATALIVVKLELALFTMAGLLLAAEGQEADLAGREAIEARARAQAAETERTVERRVAERLQEAFLPDPPRLHPSVEVAARYLAGSDAVVIGGDWYEVLELSTDQMAIVIGDVAGHGLEAAVTMGDLRTASAALAFHHRAPAALLAALDEYLIRRGRTDFATVSISVLDTSTGELTYASAGHPPLLTIDPSGASRRLEEGRSPPLFGTRVADRTQASVKLEPGTLLVGYSDGLVERRDSHLGERLDLLEARASQMRHLTPDELCDKLVEEMGVASVRRDDVVVLALRFTPLS